LAFSPQEVVAMMTKEVEEKNRKITNLIHEKEKLEGYVKDTLTFVKEQVGTLACHFEEEQTVGSGLICFVSCSGPIRYKSWRKEIKCWR